MLIASQNVVFKILLFSDVTINLLNDCRACMFWHVNEHLYVDRHVYLGVLVCRGLCPKIGIFLNHFPSL